MRLRRRRKPGKAVDDVAGDLTSGLQALQRARPHVEEAVRAFRAALERLQRH